MTEDQLQSKIFKYYHNKYCTKLNDVPHLIFSVPNGAHVSKREATKLKATGLLSGVSDLVIIQPKRCMFIELKLEKGRQQKSQIAFEHKIKNLGFEYHVVRSFDEFIKLI